MTTTTIPKRITKGAELVVMSRKEYERLLTSRLVPIFKPTATQKKALGRARKNLARGKYITLEELRHELGFTRR